MLEHLDRGVSAAEAFARLARTEREGVAYEDAEGGTGSRRDWRSPALGA